VAVNTDILTAGIWPEQNTFSVKLPPLLMKCQDHFERFYKSKHSGKHL